MLAIPAPITRRYVYTFSATEDTALRWLAHARNAKPTHTSKRIDPSQDDYALHLAGVRAEYAAARVLRCPFDMSISLDGDNAGPDLLLPNGQSAQVKYRNRRGWAFALTGDDLAEFRADVGILCWPAGAGVELVGWITRAKFARVARRVNYGHGERLAVEVAQMASITDLILEINSYHLS